MGPQDKLMVVVDTREQAPWHFDPQTVEIVSKALPAADYSLVGLEDRIALERKSLSDIVNTVIHQWIRFRKELNRLSGYDVAAIVVEANLEQIVQHEYESEANPLSVIGRINSIYLDHGIPTFFWGSHRQAADMAHRFLLLAWRRFNGR